MRESEKVRERERESVRYVQAHVTTSTWQMAHTKINITHRGQDWEGESEGERNRRSRTKSVDKQHIVLCLFRDFLSCLEEESLGCCVSFVSGFLISSRFLLFNFPSFFLLLDMSLVLALNKTIQSPTGIRITSAHKAA